MRHDRKLAFLHPWLTFLYWVAITVGVGFSLSGLLSNLPMLPSALQGRVAWAKDHSSEWTPVAILAAVLVDRIRKVVPQPWLWTTVHKLLTSFQRDIFQAELSRGDPMDLHRLTLFKRLRFRCWVCKWPWSGWLVPIERSGHTTQSTAAVFRAPDEAKRAEGVAGNTWRASVVIFRENLPDVSSAAAPPQDVADYARQTWTTPELVARRRPSARSYVGIPLDVNGKPWGVVVLDSTDAACKRSDADLRAYALLQAVLGKILERE